MCSLPPSFLVSSLPRATPEDELNPNPNPNSNPDPNPNPDQDVEIVLQGHCVNEVVDYLREAYCVDRQWIDLGKELDRKGKKILRPTADLD